MTRHSNNGLRKRCDCPRRVWPKCPHAWWFNFKPRGGPAYRISLDKHLGTHVERKADAEDAAAKICTAIRDGTFGRPAPRQDMTLRQLADVYLERYVDVERAARRDAFDGALRTICRTVVPHPAGPDLPLGDWRLTDIVTDTVERFREVRRGQGTGTVGVNRNLGSWRALFNWALRVGYVDGTPFARQAQALVKLSPEPSRSRRLNGDLGEESRLLAACPPHLRAVVECALETGMRKGEILSLQWHQVEGLTLPVDQAAVDLLRPVSTTRVTNAAVVWAPRAAIVLPQAKTKTRTERRIPISTRLRGILELRRFDPKGDALPATAYVFGNAIGQRVKDIKRAWMSAVLKAHGHKGEYTVSANLTPASRAIFDGIDLHFHDLRREAGSRWLEGGVPLHVVRDWLGHTSIAQTSTYLAGTLQTQHDAMAQFEAHRALVQRRATDSRKGGRKSPRAATPRHRKPNETAGGHHRPIM